MGDQITRNKNYSDLVYSWFQIRDCVKGSNAIKRQQELYLPMPSGMLNIPPEPSTSVTNSTSKNSRSMSLTQMPWYHPNPAYRAYLHRARFPDITGTILRGIIGIITKKDPEYELSSNVFYLEDLFSICGKGLIEAYSYLISEVMQTGKMCCVLDVTENNKFRIAFYSAERNVDWDYEVINGKKMLTRAIFIENFDDDQNEEIAIEYKLVNGIAVYQRYKSGKPFGEEEVINYQGKVLNELPVFFSGVTDNEADVDIIPLLGVSDIALTIYRKDADLSQAQYMTCNPTLFIYGINEDQIPAMIGSTVTVSISNPEAKAEYPKTDTSGLNHVKETIDGLYQEAIAVACQILGIGAKNAESAEALSIREASKGATLITVVNLGSQTINSILDFASKWSGATGSEFEGGLDFVDHSLSPNHLNAMVSSWVQGAISHDTLIDKLRNANIVDSSVTNEEEKNKIKTEQEDLNLASDPEKEDEEDE